MNDYLKNIKFNLFNYFIKTFSLVFLLIFSNFFLRYFLRNYYYSENWDRIIYLGSLLIGIFYFIKFYFFNDKKTNLNFVYLIISFVCFSCGLLFIEDNGLWNNEYPISWYIWSGFGLYNFLFIIFISLFIFDFLNEKKNTILFRNLKRVMSIFLLFSALLSFWQTNNSLIDIHHSEYVINDLLSIKSGNTPYVNYIPEYQTLFSYLMIPFQYLKLDSFVNLGLMLMFAFSIITLILCAKLVRDSLESNSWINAILLTFPLILVAPFPNRLDYYGTLSAHLNAVSGRMFLGVLILFLFTKIITQNKNQNYIFSFIFIGFLSGLFLWSNQDFSLTVIVTIVSTLWLVNDLNKSKVVKDYLYYILGVGAGIFTIPFIYKLLNYDLNFDYVGLIARSYALGYGGRKMLPGPIFLILPLIISLIVANLYILINEKRKGSEKNYFLWKNSVIGLIFGSWAVLGLTYYINLSSTSIQLQIILVPLSISLGAFVGILLYFNNTNLISFGLNNFKIQNFYKEKSFFVSFFMALIISFPVSSFISASNPIHEIQRLSETRDSPRWPTNLIYKNVENVKAGQEYAKKNNLTIAYFGYMANYISLRADVKSAILFNNPKEVLVGSFAGGIEMSCNYIKSINPDIIIVDDLYDGFSDGSNQPYKIIDLGEAGLCNKYKIIEIKGVAEGNILQK